MVSRADSTWIALHDRMDEHPKIEPLTDAAAWAFVRLLFYCHRHNNDGLIPKHRWSKQSPAIRKQLTTIQPDQKNPLVHEQDNGAQIHDYLDWQQSAEEVVAAKEASSKGGSLGNHKRWHKDKPNLKCRYCVSEGRSVPRSAPQSVVQLEGRSHG